MANSTSKEDTTLVLTTDDGTYELIVESEPFSEGGCRVAYRARMISPRECDVVIKIPKHKGKPKPAMQKTDWDMDIKASEKAEEMAKAFNEESGTSRPLHFRKPILMKVITGQFKSSSYVLVEAYLEGDYTKWNSNYRYVNEEDRTSLQAFSHFTYMETNGELLICDLQGVKDENQYSLTDPSVHSVTQEYGNTDCGREGMDNFFRQHKCDSYCSKLRLQNRDSSKSEVAEDRVTSQNRIELSNRNNDNTMLFHGLPDRKKCQAQHRSQSEATIFKGKHQAATSLEASSKAEQLKTEGNKAYKDGKLQLAIRLYTQSLQHDPGDHTVYSNRSMAYEKAKMFEKALEDAEMSTQLKPDWVKGYYRKGVALIHLRRHSDAADAYRQGLQYEPKNQGIKKALASVEEMLLQQKMASGIFGFKHATPRPLTKQEKKIERHRSVMENLHSQSKLNSLLGTGNALNDVPAPVRRALARASSSEELRSEEELPTTGTYIIHREEVCLPSGSIRLWSLHVRLEFIRETVETSRRGNVEITTTIRYYRLIMEWKADPDGNSPSAITSDEEDSEEEL